VKPRTRHTAGFTLTELVLAGAILAVSLGALTLFTSRSADALGTGALQAELDARLRRTLARVTDELLPSGAAVLSPPATAPAGSSTLTYRRSEGAVNGAIHWGAPQRLAFAYETGELDDDLDNNRNGLVDEGVVTWTRDVGSADEVSVILCHDVAEYAAGEVENDVDDDGDGLVDERGFSFERTSSHVRVHLTLARLDAQRRPLTRTLEVTLQPRN